MTPQAGQGRCDPRKVKTHDWSFRRDQSKMTQFRYRCLACGVWGFSSTFGISGTNPRAGCQPRRVYNPPRYEPDPQWAIENEVMRATSGITEWPVNVRPKNRLRAGDRDL